MNEMSLSNDELNISETLQVMRQKEKEYIVVDYMATAWHHSHEHKAVDESCRTVMAEWCMQMIDYCGFNHETVAISMNMLDRFVRQSRLALVDRNVFQLASVACLYSSIKVHEHKAVPSDTMATLSRNKYDRNQIEAMEQLILKTLKWRCHPPTTFTFGYYYCKLVGGLDFDALWEDVETQLDSVLNNYQLALAPSSYVAFAAVFNAIEGTTLFPPRRQQEMKRLVSSVAEVESYTTGIHEIRCQLVAASKTVNCATFEKQGYFIRAESPKTVSA
eukprot:scaffold2816_cov121-Cylindrotheca_fusiformis.AAC.18